MELLKYPYALSFFLGLFVESYSVSLDNGWTELVPKYWMGK